MDYFKEKFKQAKDNFNYSNNRNLLMVDNFCKIEIQIASLLASFISFVIFCENFSLIQQNVRWILFIALFLFICSLFFGLFNAHLKCGFWENITDKRYSMLKEFFKQIKEGKCSMECINKIEDTLMKSDKIYSPKWPWIIQTACLIMASLFLVVSVYFYIIQIS